MSEFRPEVARGALRDLRCRFQRLARRAPDLHHGFVEAPAERAPARRDQPPVNTGMEDRFGATISGKLRVTDPGPPARTHYYLDDGEDEEVLDEFRGLAREAGACLGAWPVSLPGMPFGPDRPIALHRFREAEFWMVVVHRLAWQNRPGTPLKTFPTVADETDAWLPGIDVSVPDGTDPREVFRIDPGIPSDCVWSWLGKCSIAQLSVYSIDLILVALDDFIATRQTSAASAEIKHAAAGAEPSSSPVPPEPSDTPEDLPCVVTVFTGPHADQIDLAGCETWPLRRPLVPADIALQDPETRRLGDGFRFTETPDRSIDYRTLIRTAAGRYVVVGTLRTDPLRGQRDPLISLHAEVSRQTARQLLLKSQYTNDHSGRYALPADLRGLPPLQAVPAPTAEDVTVSDSSVPPTEVVSCPAVVEDRGPESVSYEDSTEVDGNPPVVISSVPVDQAIQLIYSSPESVRLIRYLHGRPGHKAHLDDIAVDLDRARRATVRCRRPTIRQRFNRARSLLDEKGAPVRLHIAANVVELVFPEAGPEPATKM